MQEDALAVNNLNAPPAPGELALGEGRLLVEHAQVGLFVIQDERIVFANQVLMDLLGRTREQTIGLHHLEVAAPEFRLLVAQRLAGHVMGVEPSQRHMQCLRLDGTRFDAKALALQITFRGRPAVVVSLTDIAELAELMRNAQRNLDLLDRTEQLTRTGSVQIRLADGTVTTSKSLRRLAGLPVADDRALSLDALPWVPEDERDYVAGIWRNATLNEPFEFQHRFNGAEGTRLIVLHRGMVETDQNGELVGAGLIEDITAQREAEQRTQELESQDEVTGLPNRATFLDKLEATMMAAGWEGRSVAVMAIDVPRIGEIKTKMGYGAGDTLAMAVAARVRTFCAEGEFVAHVGDTEFAIAIEGPQQAEVAHIMARARLLRDALQVSVPLGDTNVYPLCVIGLSGYPGDGDTAAAVLEAAQTARLEAHGEERIGVCAPGSNLRAVRELAIESALRNAIAQNELVLHYQPQVDLANGQVVGAEALLRWTSAELGSVSPAEFIPVAEASGLIGTIGDWVVEAACRQIVAWRKAGMPSLRVAINVSPTQLQRPQFAGWLQSTLLRIGADPTCLGIEMTEGALMADPEMAASTLSKIRALGIEVSLDDFGTGYSSLSCLRQLPIDVVKMDRSFVLDVTATPEDMSVTRSIISMVHGLHMKVLAEGVETEAQLGLLASNRCDYIQGHYFSKALPVDDFTQLLLERRRLPPRFLTHVRATRTLLLVDDEENVISSLKRLFRAEGYEIMTASSGEEALARLAEREADVILSDQRMPGMTGVDFLRRVKALYPDSVRMVLSGYTELQSIIDAINEGSIYRFLTKPWDDANLRQQVAEAFRRKGIDDENRRLALQLEGANANYAVLNQRLERMVEQQREQSQVFARSAGNLRDMLDSMPMPVFGIDADSTLVFGNREAAPLLDDPALAAQFGLGLPLPADMRRAIAAAKTTGASFELAGRHFRLMTRPLPGGDSGDGALLMLMPVTTMETLT